MRGVPAAVGESAIPECIRIADGSPSVCYADAAGNCHALTRSQLEEVVCVYNNWRCGNLESCMLGGPFASGKVKL